MTAVQEIVHLGLGSNIGRREDHLRQAVADLRGRGDLTVRRLSPIYESRYVGPGEQDPYLNMCLELGTGLTPRELLDLLQEMERSAGRSPRTHMQPRTLDLDILLWNQRIIDEPDLRIPHPRMTERAFVLEPLAVIIPQIVVPDTGRTIAAHLAELPTAARAELQAWPRAGETD